MKRKQTRESMVKAYFTQKCIQYFLEGKEIDQTIFGYLKNAVNASLNKEKIPTIYLLALTRFYGEQKEMEVSEEEKKQLQMMTDILLEGGMVFPYMKELARLVSVPEDIMDKTILEYRGDKKKDEAMDRNAYSSPGRAFYKRRDASRLPGHLHKRNDLI